MPGTKSTVKVPIGMRVSAFFPISAEPVGARPTYGEELDMGAAVKGYLTVTTASASIPGDDITQVEIERFTSGQLDVETTMSDLEVNATLYGHKFTAEDGEISGAEDTPANGGYAMIEPILKKDKTVIYRTSCFLKVSAIASSEKQEADTKKNGELTPKNNVVSMKVMECATGEWRVRKEFPTLEEAKAYYREIFAAS